jgi:Zn-dependent protease with chaperone function
LCKLTIMNWQFVLETPLAVVLAATLSSGLWLASQRFAARLPVRVRAWMHLGLMAMTSAPFFWVFVAPLEVLWQAGSDALQAYLSNAAIVLFYRDTLMFRLMVLPVIAVGLFCGFAIIAAGVERFAAAMFIRSFDQTLEDDVTILETSRALAFTCGWLKPRVYVSRAVWESALCASVLAHERIHRARRDPLRLALAHMLCRMAVLNPFASALLRRYHAEIEYRCDQRAARAVGARTYVGALIDFACAPGNRLPAVSNFSVAELLEQRVRALMSPGHPSRFAMISALATLAVIGFGVSVRAQERVLLPTPAVFVQRYHERHPAGVWWVSVPVNPTYGAIGGVTVPLYYESESRRLVVSHVVPGGRAARDKVQVGDEITQICGQPAHEFMGPGAAGCALTVLHREGAAALQLPPLP